VDEPHAHREGLEPPLAGRVELAGADDQVLVAGHVVVLQQQRLVTVLLQRPRDVLDDVARHDPALERSTAPGVAQQRSPGGDDRAVVVDRREGAPRLDERPPRGDDDLQTGAARVADRRAVGGGDRTVGSEQGAVEVDGDRVIAHGGGHGGWSQERAAVAAG
jgi:hypothetical protein